MARTSGCIEYTWRLLFAQACVVAVLLAPLSPFDAIARAQGLVKVTLLGSHDGELCTEDRAIIFEDPTGVRILYDPGRRVDENDPRLGEVDVMLLSHAHVDHIGDRRPGSAGSGTCGAPGFGAANLQSNFASIAPPRSPPRSSSRPRWTCSSAGRFRTFSGRLRRCASPAIGTTTRSFRGRLRVCRACTLAAAFSCGAMAQPLVFGSRPYRPFIPMAFRAALIDPPGVPPGTTGYGGIAGGYMLQFTNGLTAYLTGDTGLFSDMEVLGKFYRPNLVVINIGCRHAGAHGSGVRDSALDQGQTHRDAIAFVRARHRGGQHPSGQPPGALRIAGPRFCGRGGTPQQRHPILR